MVSPDKEPLFIGLMSGTSMDGIDAVLVSFPSNGPPTIWADASLTMPAELRRTFLALNQPGANELEQAALAGVELANLYAKACMRLLQHVDLTPGDITAIGAHGQTVRHNPAQGYTIQVNAPATLAELTGIDVIADFRSRDIAAGGQGAPLVPAFHRALFQVDYPRAVLNLGGIANLTILDAPRDLTGFDTGPGNVLLDMWCQEKTGQPYDDEGQWAASGRCDPDLLNAFIEGEPWFGLPPPKSSGRDLFNREWLQRGLDSTPNPKRSDQDVQATLQSLTAVTVAEALERYAPHVNEVLVCGGGALNVGLMAELESHSGRLVMPTSHLDVPVHLVEAMAFAWLAREHVNGRTAGVPSVTGARAPRVLGCRYPA